MVSRTVRPKLLLRGVYTLVCVGGNKCTIIVYSIQMVRTAMRRNEGYRKRRQGDLIIADRKDLVIQVTFEQRPEGSKEISYGHQRKNISDTEGAQRKECSRHV